MSNTSPLQEALHLARTGDVHGALALLEPATDKTSKTLRFTLLEASGQTEQAIAAATEQLGLVGNDSAARSLWSIRRGLLYLEADDRQRGLADLTAVLRLDANEDHCTQAREAMSRHLARPASQRSSH